MSISSAFVVLAFGLFLSLLPVSADSVKLNDGTLYQGTIVSETETEVQIEIQVSKTIKDLRIVKKDDILRIEKTPADLSAIQNLRTLLPTKDNLSSRKYAQLLREKIDPFLQQYPNSQFAPEAQKIKDVLSQEQAVVVAGGVKLDGRLIPAEDRAANAYEIDSQLALRLFKEKAHKGSYRLAMQDFRNLEKDYKNTQAYADALPTAAKALNIYRLQLASQLKEIPQRLAIREKGFSSLPFDDHKKARAEVARRNRTFDRLIKKADAPGGNIWFPTDTFHEASLKKALEITEKELARIKAIDPTSLSKADVLYRKTWTNLPTSNQEDATKAIEEITKAKLHERYLRPLRKRFPKPPKVSEIPKPPTESVPVIPSTPVVPTPTVVPLSETEKTTPPEPAKVIEPVKQKTITPPRPIANRPSVPDSETEDEEKGSGLSVRIILSALLLIALLAFLIFKMIQRRKASSSETS